jgi:N-acetylglucosaminyldiphosphoundecaprenol N-acetyl-beta-D-mannosaminyltransferase
MNRVNILGVGVSPVNMESALRQMERWLDTRDHAYVVAAPVHCLIECLRNEKLRKIYNASSMVIPDGRPTTWACQLLSDSEIDQVRGPDLMLNACKRFLDRGCRHFFYGGWPPAVVEDLTSKLIQRFPGIQIAGAYSPPFRPLTEEEDSRVIDLINSTKPDIVWVGLGTTKEHLWTASHRSRISAPILIGVGAAFDFHSGRKPQAPRWMIRAGLEWLFRMSVEPTRLGPRYLRDNPAFIWNVFLQALGKTPPPL